MTNLATFTKHARCGKCDTGFKIEFVIRSIESSVKCPVCAQSVILTENGQGRV